MKNIVSLIFIAVFFSIFNIFSIPAQEWKSLNPTPTGNELKDIKFATKDIGYIVGISGTIMKTNDGGNTWLRQNSGTLYDLYSIAVVDINTAYISGTNGTILKTSDGGINWMPQNTGVGEWLFSINSVTSNGTTALYAAGSSKTIIKTTDGGIHWKILTLPSSLNTTFWSVYFTDILTGYVSGQGGVILKTYDGGNSWNTLTSGTNIALTSISFTDSNTGYISGQAGVILKTTDGGQNWIKKNLTISYDINKIYFTDALKGFVAGLNFYKTTDGGDRWTEVTTEATYPLNSICFTDGMTGYSVGASGSIIKTINGGNSWINKNKIVISENLTSISCVDNNTCYITGSNESYPPFPYPEGIILKTTDGGINWTKQLRDTTFNFNSICFPDANKGYAVGDGKKIYSTKDGGLHWKSKTVDIIDNIMYSVYFTDTATGYASGSYGIILKTTNGGKSWIKQNSNTTSDIYSLYFINSTTGFVAGAGILLKTTDGGNTWNSKDYGSIEYLKSVFFADAKKGYAVSWVGGRVIKTIDGGETWKTVYAGLGGSSITMSIFFKDSLTGYTAGDYIYKTNDGGKSWGKQSSGELNYLQAISFAKGGAGYAVGSNGSVLKNIEGASVSKYNIHGIVSYDNSSNSPMQLTKVYFKNTELNTTDSTITDSTGYYAIKLANGNYKMSILPKKSWGGADPTDALLNAKFFIKKYSYPDYLMEKAADVNSDNKINPTDALLINKRFVKLSSSFKSADWILYNDYISVNGLDILNDILVLCAGDVNGSYDFE